MNLKHRIKVNVLDPCKNKSTILTGGDHSSRNRLLTKLLGGKVGVLVLVPEGGTAHMDVRRVDKPQSWNELLAIVGEVAATPPCHRAC